MSELYTTLNMNIGTVTCRPYVFKANHLNIDCSSVLQNHHTHENEAGHHELVLVLNVHVVYLK